MYTCMRTLKQIKERATTATDSLAPIVINQFP